MFNLMFAGGKTYLFVAGFFSGADPCCVSYTFFTPKKLTANQLVPSIASTFQPV